MDMHEAFVRDILKHPADVARRLIYADWLEEQGDTQSLARAALLRLELERAGLEADDPRHKQLDGRIKETRAQVETDWLAALAQVRIEACGRWKFRCPQQWEKLRLTDDARVRHCTACRKNVHYCTTIEDAQSHARQGHCVAVDTAVQRWPGDLIPELTAVTLGIIDPDWEPEGRRRGRQ
jgi:uncharacterized protein (TIGR02996 family)